MQEIIGKIIISPQQKARMRKKIESRNWYNDEQVWTYLILNILTKKSNDQKKYFQKMCGRNIPLNNLINLGFETQPYSPRLGERNTHLDLALGSIRDRGRDKKKTRSGIEYDPDGCHWVCFIEAKVFSDCSLDVKNDPFRNQIVRVIENLLCFQPHYISPIKMIFTLLTPRIFQNNPGLRLFSYKMKEYRDYQKDNVRKKILADINKARMEKRIEKGDWKYPDIEERIKLLQIRWRSYEEILEKHFDIKQLDITNIKNNLEYKNKIEKYFETI